MTIWEIYNTNHNGFYLLDMDDRTFFDTFQFCHFDGNPLYNKWKPINVTLLAKDVTGNELSPTIMPYLGRGYFVIANEYLPALDELCKKAYEKLELNCNKGHYTLINIINPIDCLDLKNMSYKTYKGNPQEIQRIYKFAFFKDKIDRPIFKIKDYAIGHIFCTDEFKKLMEGWQVGGLIFEKAWEYEV